MVQTKLKEKKYNKDSFIGGWYIPSDICDKLIDYYEFNKEFCFDGVTLKHGGERKDIKDSKDLIVGYSNFDNIIGEYRKQLQLVLNHYMEKYPYSSKVESFDICENYNMQKYPVGGGFKAWHSEITDHYRLIRHLVFMTYLNDVDDGGTEFAHQNIKTKAEKGLTLIWPTAWTHAHRGVVSNTKEKYIITGWYNFINDK